MGSRAAALVAVLALAAALCSGSASAAPPWANDLALIRRGLDRAQAMGRLSAAEASTYRSTVAQAAGDLPRLPGSRYRNLAAVVHEVAGLWKGYDEPRGRTLFAMLAFNVNWFSSHWDRKAGTDVVDYSDGIWYRAFPGLGFQFHPLENFGKLNSFVSQQNQSRASQLAQALLARAVSRNGGLAWEYYFGFEGGRPPWISGMAQAVAAQALARAGTLVPDPTLVAASRRVYATIPSLLRQSPTGPWIRLYAFNNETVLNAQLQTIASLLDYAAASGDTAAASLAAQLESATDGLLPRFDTGYWSLYSLGGPEAPLDYHQFVVRLLANLAKRTQDQTLAAFAQRFGADLTEPPLLKAGTPPAPIYPWPADGYKDGARYPFWVSKRSTVRLVVANAGGPLVVSRGWHAIFWSPGRIAPGSYTPKLDAVDLAGNAAETVLAPVEVRLDTEPPTLSAKLVGRRLYWRGADDASPWLSFRITLRRGGSVRRVFLAAEPFRGSARLRAPRGAWAATLEASDSSGNATRVVLGTLHAHG
ncbi:MAG TPA: D-glucuronyl C5-epimerase family protein [Gaiellaceae bacterium]